MPLTEREMELLRIIQILDSEPDSFLSAKNIADIYSSMYLSTPMTINHARRLLDLLSEAEYIESRSSSRPGVHILTHRKNKRQLFSEQ